MSDLTAYRAEKDRYFKMSPDSPIPPEDRASFQGRLRPRFEYDSSHQEQATPRLLPAPARPAPS